MNAKRQQKSTTAERKFCTYTEDDIWAAPEMKSIGPQLTRDKPAGRTSPEQIAHDKMVAGTLGHHNYRADPELQKEGRPTSRVIAVRRIPCLCVRDAEGIYSYPWRASDLNQASAGLASPAATIHTITRTCVWPPERLEAMQPGPEH